MSSVLDVKIVDGFYHVDMGDGLLLPIRNGRKMDEFSGGWSPVCASKEFLPVVVLLLRREDGVLAPWYLDAELNRVGGTVAEIPPHLRVPMLERVAKVFQTIVSFAHPFCGSKGVEATADLAIFGEQILGDLADSAAQAADPKVRVIKRADVDFNLSEEDIEANLPYLRRAFEGKLQHDFLLLIRNKELRRPSPLSGLSCSARIGLILTPRLTAYQFVDELADTLFYVIPDHYFEQVIAIYVPHLRVYIVENGAPPFAELFWRLSTHVIANHKAITCFMNASTKLPVNFLSDFPWLHIGHVLWNELSGLEELINLIENDLLPHVCVINASMGSEVYGPIDNLFPEFSDRLLRWETPWSAVAEKVYNAGFLYFRYMTKFVRSRVGIRVLSSVKQDPRLMDDQQTAERLCDETRIGVCLGLRCGNRMIQDQTQFLILSIEHLIDRLGRVTVILDGMNSRINSDPTTLYGAFGPANDEDNLIIELKTVFEVRRRFRGNPQVEIISTVGRSINASLFWINKSRFFVAPWGAALAKYRWICNKPGFVMTNRPILANPIGDIMIYHHSDYMESPSKLAFIALDKVSDAPGPGGFYANFLPDPGAIRAGIDSLIEDARLSPIRA